MDWYSSSTNYLTKEVLSAAGVVVVVAADEVVEGVEAALESDAAAEVVEVPLVFEPFEALEVPLPLLLLLFEVLLLEEVDDEEPVSLPIATAAATMVAIMMPIRTMSTKSAAAGFMFVAMFFVWLVKVMMFK
jgi:hypothetical protein